MPFKAIYALQGKGARVHIEPETLHPLWNSCKGALNASGLMIPLLIGMLMSQVDHGPFTAGTNFLHKKECMEFLVRNISYDHFITLLEGIRFDRCVSVHDDPAPGIIPECKEDLLLEGAVCKLSHNAARVNQQ